MGRNFDTFIFGFRGKARFLLPFQALAFELLEHCGSEAVRLGQRYEAWQLRLEVLLLHRCRERRLSISHDLGEHLLRSHLVLQSFTQLRQILLDLVVGVFQIGVILHEFFPHFITSVVAPVDRLHPKLSKQLSFFTHIDIRRAELDALVEGSHFDV